MNNFWPLRIMLIRHGKLMRCKSIPRFPLQSTRTIFSPMNLLGPRETYMKNPRNLWLFSVTSLAPFSIKSIKCPVVIVTHWILVFDQSFTTILPPLNHTIPGFTTLQKLGLLTISCSFRTWPSWALKETPRKSSWPLSLHWKQFCWLSSKCSFFPKDPQASTLKKLGWWDYCLQKTSLSTHKHIFPQIISWFYIWYYIYILCATSYQKSWKNEQPRRNWSDLSFD